MNQPKLAPREWKLQYNPETKELDYYYRHNCCDGFEDVHVVEYSALHEAEQKIAELEESDFQWTQEMDIILSRVKSANEMLKKISEALEEVYICNRGINLNAEHALKEYEEWKKK